MLNLDELQRKATSGRITDEEVAMVVNELNKPSGNHNKEHLLLILSRAPQGLQYRSLFEKYLTQVDDIGATGHALQTLCSWWGFAGEYLDDLTKFILGIEEDLINSLRNRAIMIAALYTFHSDNKELLRPILQVFDDKTINFVSRACAYEAISLVLGYADGRRKAIDIIESGNSNELDSPDILARIQEARELLTSGTDSSATVKKI